MDPRTSTIGEAYHIRTSPRLLNLPKPRLAEVPIDFLLGWGEEVFGLEEVLQSHVEMLHIPGIRYYRH